MCLFRVRPNSITTFQLNCDKLQSFVFVSSHHVVSHFSIKPGHLDHPCPCFTYLCMSTPCCSLVHSEMARHVLCMCVFNLLVELKKCTHLITVMRYACVAVMQRLLVDRQADEHKTGHLRFTGVLCVTWTLLFLMLELGFNYSSLYFQSESLIKVLKTSCLDMEGLSLKFILINVI